MGGLQWIVLFVTLVVCSSQIHKTAINESEVPILFQQLDRSVNPCDDFYQFTCGNATQLLITMRALYDTSDRQYLELYNEPISDSDHFMVQTVKKLFQSCNDVAAIEKQGLKTIKDVLTKLGGWPILLGENWNEDQFNWVHTTYRLRTFGYMFPVYLDILPETITLNGYKVSLPRAQHYVVGNSTETTAYILKIVTAFGADRQQVSKDIEDIVGFGKKLHEALNEYLESEEPSKKVKVDDYQKLVKDIDWLEFLNKIISPAVHVSKRDMVTFPDENELNKWLDLINKTPKRVQANYMLWKVVEQVIPYLSTDLQRYKFQGKRADFCGKEVERRFPANPIILMHLRKYLPKYKKQQVEHLVNNIKTELALTVIKFDWLSPEEKKVAVDKINGLKLLIGVPGDYFTNETLDQLSVDMEPTENGSFLELLAQANRNLESQKYAGTALKLLFTGKYYLIMYGTDKNILYIPEALLHPPFYDETRPNYLNYGSLGIMIIGELSDIFHSKMITTTKRILSDSTIAGIEKMQGCIMGDLDLQVFSYEADITNARLILDYVIAQNVSYDAYRKWAKNNGEEVGLPGASYTANQLFWMSSAFCDAQNNPKAEKSIKRPFGDFRIYTALRNNPNFAKDYNCPTGARMSPIKRCQVF